MRLALERTAFPGLAAWWRRGATPPGDNSTGGTKSRDSYKLSLLAGIALLAIASGVVVAVAELNALYLCISLIGCAFILRDFRIGVFLLIILMPISASYLFPHAMLGITGLNPFNLLLIGTLAACLFHAVFDGTLGRFLPRALLWLYIAPIVFAAVLGSRHVAEIAPAFYIMELVEFEDLTGYVRDMAVKPLFLVILTLLVGAAVARSEKPEKFLIPIVISVWTIALVIVVFVAQSGVALNQLASSDSRDFLSALGLHANDLGRLFAIGYALLLFTWAGTTHSGYRFVLLISMAVVVSALLLTFSRGAFVGFIIVNALFLIWRRSVKTMVFFALIASLALFALPAAVYDRASTGMGEGLNAVSAGRVEGLWLPLLPEVLRSPVYGSGLGSMMWSDTMRVAGGSTVIQAIHPHNAYLQILLDMGVLGLILFSAYFFHVWKNFRLLSRDPSLNPMLRGFYQGASAGLLCLLVSNVTDGSFVPRPEQVFLWLAIGMMYGQLHKRHAS